MNNPALVNALLNGEKHLIARPQSTQEGGEKEYEIAFKETRTEEGWAAAILWNGKPITRPYRKISLDFEILNGLYDMLRLIAAFVDPREDVVFTVKENDGAVVESYLVHYIESNEKRRCVEFWK